MKTGFKNILEPKKVVNANPPYDERSGPFVCRGDYYGVGHNAPVGTKKHSGKYAVPVGRVATMSVDEEG